MDFGTTWKSEKRGDLFLLWKGFGLTSQLISVFIITVQNVDFSTWYLSDWYCWKLGSLEVEKENTIGSVFYQLLKHFFWSNFKFSCTGLKNLFHGYALRNSKNESTSVHFFALVPVSGYDLF